MIGLFIPGNKRHPPCVASQLIATGAGAGRRVVNFRISLLSWI